MVDRGSDALQLWQLERNNIQIIPSEQFATMAQWKLRLQQRQSTNQQHYQQQQYQQQQQHGSRQSNEKRVVSAAVRLSFVNEECDLLGNINHSLNKKEGNNHKNYKKENNDNDNDNNNESNKNDDKTEKIEKDALIFGCSGYNNTIVRREYLKRYLRSGEYESESIWEWSNQITVPSSMSRGRRHVMIKNKLSNFEDLVSFVTLLHRNVVHTIFFRCGQPPVLIRNETNHNLLYCQALIDANEHSVGPFQASAFDWRCEIKGGEDLTENTFGNQQSNAAQQSQQQFQSQSQQQQQYGGGKYGGLPKQQQNYDNRNRSGNPDFQQRQEKDNTSNEKARDTQNEWADEEIVFEKSRKPIGIMFRIDGFCASDCVYLRHGMSKNLHLQRLPLCYYFDLFLCVCVCVCVCVCWYLVSDGIGIGRECAVVCDLITHFQSRKVSRGDCVRIHNLQSN